MSGIFISYRRADSPDATGRIYDRLIAEFGKEHVFKDIDSIPLGQDFRTHLNDRVGDCSVVLAIIGPHWSDARDASGQRRLDDADDFVRIELEAALARSIPVVPVLVGDAQMPAMAQLPASLGQLPYRQSIEVRPDPDFHNDATRLASALRHVLAGQPWAPEPEAPRSPAAASRPAVLPWVVAAIGIAAAATVSAVHFRAAPAPAAPQVRFTIAPPDGSRFGRVQGSTPAGMLSADGSKIAYPVSGKDGRRSLWLRSFDATVSRPLPGTDDAVPGCWSPDGKGFAFSVARRMKRIEIASGVITDLGETVAAGCAWNQDGVILLPNQPIQRITTAGGVPVPATLSKAGADVVPNGQRFPVFLPDGRHFLFHTGIAEPDVWVGDLDAPNDAVHLMKSHSQVLYSDGYLLYLNGNTLLARRFDVGSLSLQGEPLPIVEHVRNNVNRASNLAAFTVSANGWLAFQQGSSSEPLNLVMLDRAGKRAGVIGAPADFFDAVYSPDRRRIAGVVTEVTGGGSTSDIWLYDVQGGVRTRFTVGPAIYNGATWSPDGKTLVYFSYEKLGLYRRPTDGSRNQELLVANARPTSFSPDGRFLAYSTRDDKPPDIWILPDPLGPPGAAKPYPFIQGPGNQDYAQFSPDGHWIAYQSDESGRNEIYTAPFPGPGAKRRVSTDGGTRPRWNPNGRELLFVSADRRIMSADITPGPVLQVGAVRPLFGDFVPTAFDVSLDGQRLLTILEPEDKVEEPITVVMNWRASLKP